MNLQDRKATQSMLGAVSVARATKKLALILALGALLGGCVTNVQAFKAYVGEVNSQMQVSVIHGGQLVRNDLMNINNRAGCFIDKFSAQNLHITR
ncbi:hypothetical protein N9I87_04335 [Gammaproteobacteria bacterium]|nr:hypothetical protein [Gammaproteobacteria bacterium]